MMFRDSYDSYARIPEWLRACRSRGIRIAAFHADKHIGDLLSDPDELSLRGAGPVRKELCAAAFGARSGHRPLLGRAGQRQERADAFTNGSG